jgi:hypothetical protein
MHVYIVGVLYLEIIQQMSALFDMSDLYYF